MANDLRSLPNEGIYMKTRWLLASILPLSCLFGATEGWNVDASSNWNSVSNWLGILSPTQVPNAIDDGAQLGPFVLTAPRTITLDISPTIGTLTLFSGNANGYTIAGPGTLNFQATTTPELLLLGSSLASYTITAPLNVVGAQRLQVNQSATGQTLTISGGISGGQDVEYAGSSTVILSGTNTYLATSLLGTVTLRLASANTLPVGRAVTLGLGATGTLLDLNGFNQSIGTLSSVGTGGVVQLGNPAGHLTINQTGSATFSGVIDGTVSSGTAVDWTGSGVGSVWTLGAAQTYTGFTSITNGTIRILGPEFLPPGGGLILAANGVLDMNGYQQTISDPVIPVGSQIIMNGAGGVSSLAILGSAGPVTLAGVISDGGLGGQVIWNGSGTQTVTITTPQTYTGGTLVNQGTMNLGVANALFSGGNLTLTSTGIFNVNGFTQTIGQLTAPTGSQVQLGSGTLTVTPSASSTVGSVMSGTGGSVIWNGGVATVTTLTGASTYTGGTTISSGTVRLGVANALLSGGDVTLAAAGTLNLNNFSQTIGQLTAPAGSLQLGSGVLTVQPTASSTLGVSISGTGSVVWNGGAATVTTLGVVQGYTGGTTINSGTLQLGAAGGLAPSSNLTLGAAGIFDLNGVSQTVGNLTGAAGSQIQLGAGTLTVAPTSSSTFAGGISGAGSLSVAGSSPLYLSGANTLAGTTTITSGGELGLALGSLTGAVQVNLGGVLSGAGTVGSVVNDGTVSPVGILNVTGSYTQNAGGAFNIGISSMGAPNRLDAGSATLNGTLNVSAVHGAYVAGQQFRILTTTGAVTPAFTTVNLPSFLDLILTYEPNAVVLTLAGQAILPLSNVNGYNPNQVLNYLREIEHSADSELIQIIDSLAQLDTDQLTEALDQMHPAPFGAFDLLNASTSAQIASLFNRHMGKSCCLAPSSPEPCALRFFNTTAEPKQETNKPCGCADSSFWIQPFGETYSQDKIGEQVGFFSTTGGILSGLGHRFPSHIKIGVGGGYSSSNIHWDEHRGRGKMEAGYFGIYADYTRRTYYLEASAIGSVDKFSASRHLQFTIVNQHARHKAGGHNFTAHLGAGGEIHLTHCYLNPYASFDYFYLSQKGFKEQGAGDLNLVVQGRHSNILRSELGLTITQPYPIGENGCFSPTFWLSGINETFLTRELYHSRFVGETLRFRSRTFHKPIYLISPGIDLSFWFKKRFNFSLRYSAELNHQIANQKVDTRLEWLF